MPNELGSSYPLERWLASVERWSRRCRVIGDRVAGILDPVAVSAVAGSFLTADWVHRGQQEAKAAPAAS